MSIEQLKAAVDSASSEVRTAYLSFAIFSLYFAVTVGATTHEELLRGSEVSMPALGVGLPIVGFYILVPPLLVLFHALLLLQFNVLATRVRQLRFEVEERVDAEEEIAPPFVLTQFLFGPKQGFMVRELVLAAIWISMILLPIGILIFVQVRFLPYHSEWVTWWHRVLIVADLALVWLIWPQILKLRGEKHLRKTSAGRSPIEPTRGAWKIRITNLSMHHRLPMPRGYVGLLVITVPTFLFSWFLATIPTSPGLAEQPSADSGKTEQAVSSAPAYDTCDWTWNPMAYSIEVSLPTAVASGVPRTVSCLSYLLFEAPTTLLNMRRNLRLRSADLVEIPPRDALILELGSEKAWEEDSRGLNLRGRDLRYADLSRSDLRKADLRGADLFGANLAFTDLRYAQAGDVRREEFDACPSALQVGSICVNRFTDANLMNADLRLARFRRADLQRVNLRYANLKAADLAGARLTKASLRGAALEGAQLKGANLDGAELRGAELAGADLKEASLLETSLVEADLTMAHLKDAKLDKADLSSARLDGALLSGASLSGANLTNAYLSGADLRGVRLDGATLGDKGSFAFFGWVDASSIDDHTPKEVLDQIWRFAPEALPNVDRESYERKLALLLTGKACREGTSPFALHALIKRVVEDIKLTGGYRSHHPKVARRLLYQIARTDAAPIGRGSEQARFISSALDCPPALDMPQHLRNSLRAILLQQIDVE